MLPNSSPFSPDQRKALDSLLAEFDALQRGWLSGFLASSGAPAAVQSAPAVAGKLTVLYGTESGNSEELADRAIKVAKKKGFKRKKKE